jgi:site-specific DNA recombinase
MTPSHARKGAIKYRYYISSALVQGQVEQAGTVSRVPANEIEALVAKSIRNHLGEHADSEDAVLIRDHVVRIEVQSDQLIIELANAKGGAAKRKRGIERIEVPWRKTPSKRRREILVPETVAPHQVRPIRSENRALLVASIARGRRWLDELITAPDSNVEAIAARECCSARKVNMTISLAFLAPDLVRAAIEGRLPHGMGVARLCELPAEWSRQHHILGLTAPSSPTFEPVSSARSLFPRKRDSKPRD